MVAIDKEVTLVTMGHTVFMQHALGVVLGPPLKYSEACRQFFDQTNCNTTDWNYGVRRKANFAFHLHSIKRKTPSIYRIMVLNFGDLDLLIVILHPVWAPEQGLPRSVERNTALLAVQVTYRTAEAANFTVLLVCGKEQQISGAEQNKLAPESFKEGIDWFLVCSGGRIKHSAHFDGLLPLARGGGPFSESPEVLKNLNSVHEERPYGHPPSKIQGNLLRQEYYIHDSILAPGKISPLNDISSIETSSYHLKVVYKQHLSKWGHYCQMKWKYSGRTRTAQAFVEFPGQIPVQTGYFSAFSTITPFYLKKTQFRSKNLVPGRHSSIFEGSI
ncbi:hypothetical protein K438DRAFT_1760885 [Mycena galopus ATCC 62051]|nr:hypothetical protein K438DRAFT_1760885 [Mycena galopus ATCC 62051]